jgi:hypothetical protein
MHGGSLPCETIPSFVRALREEPFAYQGKCSGVNSPPIQEPRNRDRLTAGIEDGDGEVIAPAFAGEQVPGRCGRDSRLGTSCERLHPVVTRVECAKSERHSLRSIRGRSETRFMSPPCT